LAQAAARQGALEQLERDRVGLAPAAAALLGTRERFGDAVLGPLADFVRVRREDAALAEHVLGEWMHAVVVSDLAACERDPRVHRDAGDRPACCSSPWSRGRPATGWRRPDGPG